MIPFEITTSADAQILDVHAFAARELALQACDSILHSLFDRKSGVLVETYWRELDQAEKEYVECRMAIGRYLGEVPTKEALLSAIYQD
jgi:hypothetical protein